MRCSSSHVQSCSSSQLSYWSTTEQYCCYAATFFFLTILMPNELTVGPPAVFCFLAAGSSAIFVLLLVEGMVKIRWVVRDTKGALFLRAWAKSGGWYIHGSFELAGKLYIRMGGPETL